MDYYFEPAPFYWIEDGATQASTKKRKYNNKKKKEYVGWASRELIEFLVSVGKDATKALSQQEVTAVINQYVLERNLINPAKKKRVLCDEKLQSLFGRKQSIARNKIYDLLDLHLVENKIDSDGDASGSPDENDDDGGAVYTKQKILTSDKKTQPKKAPSVPKSSLIAINAENIKLVFLRKSVVQKLLNNRETFENKVVGSFVRVKSDPHDIFQKNSNELHLVSGVVDVAPAGDKWSPLLQISRMADNVEISALSDENFSEEEIQDLHRRVKDGLLKQPTVGELEIKVAAVHEDITKHWLEKELVLLKNLIDRANEKGWRYKVLEYSDRRKLLESPAEQLRLLSEIPNVIPEEVKADTIDEGSPDDSPKAVDWDWEPFDVSSNGVAKKPDVISELVGQGAAEISTSNGYAHHPSSPEEKNQRGTSFLAAVDNGHAQFDPKEKEAPNNHKGTIEIESNVHTEFLDLNHPDIRKSESQQESNGHLQLPTPKEPEKAQVVIDLSDDDDEEEQKPPAPGGEHGNRISVPHPERKPLAPGGERGNRIPVLHPEHNPPAPGGEHGNQIPVPHPEHLAWYYFDPHGRVQGPFSLTSLKQWSDLNFFPPDFKVWQIGQSPHEAVLLSQLLCTLWWSMPKFQL